jgi:hypothetical protein
MIYSCRGECKKTDLKLKQMKLEPYVKSNGRGICKLCHSKDTIVRIQEKRADQNPEDYMCCNECDKTFRKYTSGPVPKKKPRKMHDKCIYCQSSDIEAYA